MKKPTELMALLDGYRGELDAALDSFLKKKGSLPVYGMVRYFMGFTDSSFNPVTVYGGKRFRSGLSLFIGDAFNAKDRTIDAAMSLELFHNFTLIHDDIVDGDAVRRGRPTVWKLWGVNEAINTGDVQSLLACQKLMEGARRYPDTGTAVAEHLVASYAEVGEGQHLDFSLSQSSLGDPSVTEKAYLAMIDKKTAVLVGAGAKAAAIAATRPEDECDQFWNYGHSLGLAYQLYDDFVGIWGEADASGKTQLSDLRERKKTLPVLLAFQSLAKGDRARFSELYDSEGTLDSGSIQELLSLINKTDAKKSMQTAVERASARAREAAEKTSLPPGKKGILLKIVDMLLPSL